VDLLDLARRLDDATDLLSWSRTGLDATVWKALLGACWTRRLLSMRPTWYGCWCRHIRVRGVAATATIKMVAHVYLRNIIPRDANCFYHLTDIISVGIYHCESLTFFADRFKIANMYFCFEECFK
jgi:hypothetical protein